MQCGGLVTPLTSYRSRKMIKKSAAPRLGPLHAQGSRNFTQLIALSRPRLSYPTIWTLAHVQHTRCTSRAPLLSSPSALLSPLWQPLATSGYLSPLLSSLPSGLRIYMNGIRSPSSPLSASACVCVSVHVSVRLSPSLVCLITIHRPLASRPSFPTLFVAPGPRVRCASYGTVSKYLGCGCII